MSTPPIWAAKPALTRRRKAGDRRAVRIRFKYSLGLVAGQGIIVGNRRRMWAGLCCVCKWLLMLGLWVM